MRPHHQATDSLVIGGGLAGSMAALRLAAAGRSTLLIEKEKSAHHKVCGEFLSPEAVGYLRQAGINPVALGAAPINRLRLSVGNHTVETQLLFTALSLSRHLLDEALLKRTADEGCIVRRGYAVDKLTSQGASPEGASCTAYLANGESIEARSVFLATGKHDLRGWPRSSGIQSDLVGFKLHWRLHPAQTAALRYVMDLYLFRGGYGGISLVEQDIANLCLVVRKAVLRRLGGWPQLLSSILAENQLIRACLGSAQPLWDRPLAVSSIPYGLLGSPFSFQNLWPLGDQIAVIPSFTGDGMSIALHSAALAVEMHLAGATPAGYERKLVGQLGRGMKLATALSRAIVHPLPRRAAPLALSLFPQAMSWIAAATRIPSAAIVSRPELRLAGQRL